MAEANLEYRKLGRSGLKISPLCLGTMMFGGATDEPTSVRIIAKARDAGVNFIDTADAYNQGRSEEITGRGIAAERDSGYWRPSSRTRWARAPTSAASRANG